MLTIKSPGRINLIGEHIDYNGGEVMPAAIDLCILLKLNANDSSTCNIHSIDYEDTFSVDLEKVVPSETEWHNYFLGVIYFIQQKLPGRIKSFDCTIESNLPIGSGMSSSAALECGIAKGLDGLFDLGLTNLDIITIARDAEHHFVGTKCGIMDQFAVVNGKKGHFMKLNCQTLEVEYVKADLDPYELLLLNTNVEHSLATSEYNKRRSECEQGLHLINAQGYNFKDVAHIPYGIIDEKKHHLPVKTFNRMKFVLEENQRTAMASSALLNNDLKALGLCIYGSHEGLKNLYEVSCEELDFLVDFTRVDDTVLGARMMGGGFGGCTLNIIRKDKKDDFIDQISRAYFKKFKTDLTAYTVKIGDGVRNLK